MTTLIESNYDLNNVITRRKMSKELSESRILLLEGRLDAELVKNSLVNQKEIQEPVLLAVCKGRDNVILKFKEFENQYPIFGMVDMDYDFEGKTIENSLNVIDTSPLVTFPSSFMDSSDKFLELLNKSTARLRAKLARKGYDVSKIPKEIKDSEAKKIFQISKSITVIKQFKGRLNVKEQERFDDTFQWHDLNFEEENDTMYSMFEYQFNTEEEVNKCLIFRKKYTDFINACWVTDHSVVYSLRCWCRRYLGFRPDEKLVERVVRDSIIEICKHSKAKNNIILRRLIEKLEGNTIIS